MTYLNKMIPGQRGKVIGFTKDGKLSRRLLELGLVPGRSIKYIRNAPLRDPMQIKIGSSFLTIRHSEASLVAIEVED